jgi:uncharacterized protein YceK
MFRIFVFIFISLSLTGCASLMNQATQKMADNLSAAMLNQDDLETVKAGSPAYLILIDSLIEGNPEDSGLMLSRSRLYSSYASAFVEEPTRRKRLAAKSLDYARQALCLELKEICDKLVSRSEDFSGLIDTVQVKDQPLLYGFASAWAGWLQANTDDWNAVAQIPKLNTLFERSLELDEQYDNGGAHLYLGVLNSQIPATLGGKPERAKNHFEKADRLSAGKNLMVKVLYAEHYARLVFDQSLHDQLLKDVLGAEVNHPGLTLVNALAKQRAGQLLQESKEFF